MMIEVARNTRRFKVHIRNRSAIAFSEKKSIVTFLNS
jgi:hypothetical protein